MALRPVCMGSLTDLRGMMPGALTSTRLRFTSVRGPLPSMGLPRAVDDAPEEAAADGDVDDVAGAGDGVALADAGVVAEDDDADVVGLEVEGHAFDAGGGELDEFAGHDVLEAEDAGDAVADGENLAGFGDVLLSIERGDLFLEDFRDFGGTDFH